MPGTPHCGPPTAVLCAIGFFLTLHPCPSLAAGQLKPGASTAAAPKRARAVESPDLLLTSDRTLYRPGQRICVRCVVFGKRRRTPLAKRKVAFKIIGPGGRRLLRREETTKRLGVAAADLPLDELAPLGIYVVWASVGHHTVKRQLKVANY